MKRLVCMPVSLGGRAFAAQLFEAVMEYVPGMDLDKKDVLLFEGGVDISPALYGEKSGKYTQRPDDERDKFEVAAWEHAQKAGAACFGICRGAQLFTVLNGGKLIQHVSNHGHGNHLITLADNKQIESSSVHHQMMSPIGTDHQLVAWASESRSDLYLDGEDNDCSDRLDDYLGLEPEVVWYPKTRSFAVQGHPEFMNSGSDFVAYCRHWILAYLIRRQFD